MSEVIHQEFAAEFIKELQKELHETGKALEAYKTLCYYRPHPKEWWDGDMSKEAEDKYNSAMTTVKHFEDIEAAKKEKVDQ